MLCEEETLPAHSDGQGFWEELDELWEAAPVLSGAGALVLGLEALTFQNLLIQLPKCQRSGLQALMELLFFLLYLQTVRPRQRG